jgi:hypothetical protein
MTWSCQYPDRNETECSADINRYRPCEYELDHGPWEPVSGGALAISGLFYNVFKGFGEIGSDLVRLSTVIESSSARRPRDSFTYSVNSSRDATITQSKLDGKTLGSDSLKGVARIFKTTARAPMAFTLAMAQGAHNAPRMWGDKTVRPQEKITGLGSGLAAAGKVGLLSSFYPFFEQFDLVCLCIYECLPCRCGKIC